MRNIYFNILISIFIIFNINTYLVSSLTLLQSEINENITLKYEFSPYYASEDVIIARRAKLTIEPGCEIKFAKGKQLIVNGVLDARGTELKRIKFTKITDNDQANNYTHRSNFYTNNQFRLVEGETIQDGKLQIYFNNRWNYVCSTQFNWTEIDVNVTCKSLGFNNGTFYYYQPSNNLTSHMKVFMPRCGGRENSLFECPGTSDPELGLTVCDNQNVVSIVCEGFHNDEADKYDNWGGIVFQKYSPYLQKRMFLSVLYNYSQSILEYVDVTYAGLVINTNRYRPLYKYYPGSAITVFQYAPMFNFITIEHSIGNGLNYSNIEAPAIITNSMFRYNRGHGITAKTRFGNITIVNTISQDNLGDGLKYYFNNTAWSIQEQEEYFYSRYLEYCDSQNPLSYPAYYKFRNPNYVRECSKTFSTEPEMRITLHFQKVNIRSKYSTYWLEVYDGQTEKNPLIANYTFENGKTPEAIFSRSNYMFVKLRFQCNYPSDRTLQPVEIEQMQQRNKWDQFKTQQQQYERNLFQYNPPFIPGLRADRPWQEPPNKNIPPFNLNQLSVQDQKQQLYLFDKEQKEQDAKFQQKMDQKQHDLQQSRIFCPYSNYDDITMYAMVGDLKHPDLLIKDSHFSNNSLSGINATNLHSLVQINQTSIRNNQMNGIHVQGGAGDLSLYHSQVEFNLMNGINITYAGGLKEFNYSHISNNGLYGIYANYDVVQEFDNIFQNTTLNSSFIESNQLGGVYLGSYCNQSNITINATIFRNNLEDALVIDSCKSADGEDWYMLNPLDRVKVNYKRYMNLTLLIKYAHVNISWNLFESNRLHGLKIIGIQNMIGVIGNNTFLNHKKGALLITANTSRTDSVIRNVSMQIHYNNFYNNSGRYVLNVGLNEFADRTAQSINITFNRFENNNIIDPYGLQGFNARSSVCAVAIVSSSNIAIFQNIFNNPGSKIQIGTQLENYTSYINASYNWFGSLTPVYQLDYYLSNRDKCNQQWKIVRSQVFDHSNRSNLAQIVYWPFSCNDRLWYFESSIDKAPPADFEMWSTESLGGVYDFNDATLPVNRYTVVNDIVVKPGAKLTLKSGTELNFLNGIGMLVLGELVIDGVVSSPVRFSLASRPINNYLRSIAIPQPQPLSLLKKSTENNSTSFISDNNSTILTNLTIKPILEAPKPLMTTLSIDLVDGHTPYEGRLRVEMNGQYGTICNRGWTIVNSRIACQQMGLILDPSLFIYSRWLSNDHRQNEPILMSEVQCDPLDVNIFECRHTKRYDHTCTHQDDVWIKCIKPGWAGVRFGMNSLPSSLKFAVFEHAGQYDYHKSELASALQFDLMQHILSNLTFQHNQHTSLEILFNQPFKKTNMNNLDFISNMAAGLVTRTSFLRVSQVYGQNHQYHPVIEYNPTFSLQTLQTVRLYSSQPRRGYDVRRELTRLPNNIWHIGSEQMVLLYTDVEYNFGPQELNIQIHTDNNRVIVVDLIDYNTNFEQEKVVFCEKFCQQSYADSNSREWNLTLASNTFYFPINTSYSVLHINYNVTNLKSGRLMFIVYSVKAPEPVYDYFNPSYVYVRNIMPDNVLMIHNSTFYNNRHSIVVRHYDEPIDALGNLRKRYNYTNIMISNSTFDSNDQIFWVNTDPVIPNFYQRTNNLTIHVMHSLFDSNKDDVLIAESGYQMFDLIPSVKHGPLGRINVTFVDNIIKNNYGGIRSLYRYYEYSNTLWHYEIKNNKFIENKQGCLKILLPRIYRFAIKNDWENRTHSFNIDNNEFSANRLFEISIDGYYAEINMTRNLFIDNMCRIGMVKMSGTEKDLYIYRNQIERNEANFLFDLEAESHADNDIDYESLFVDNIIEQNRKPSISSNMRNFNSYNAYDDSSMRDAANLFIQNSPSSYTIALRGIQNCSFHRNIFENDMFDYEFVGAMSTNTLNSTIDATVNWWGSSNATVVKKRIFDIYEWNNHALVNFIPYTANRIDYSLSRAQPELPIIQDDNIIGGIIYGELTLQRTPVPYQVKSDITILPGASLNIGPGVEMEFYPNVGILVLGDLKASGTQEEMIKMRPVKRAKNRIPYFSSMFAETLMNIKYDFKFEQKETDNYKEPHYVSYATNRDSTYLNSSKRLRFFDGLSPNEGFLQIYNATLRSWTMICDRQFTLTSASIVCKQMGKEHRNPLVQSLFYYMAPHLRQPIWNQTFICKGGEQSLAECDTFANYHMSECRERGEYTYIMCKPYNLDKQGYESSWGGIRFAQPYFEASYSQNHFGLPETPIYLKPEFQQQQKDDSYMYFVDIQGAGRLHNELSPAVQLVHRAPIISFCNIKDSTYHGLEFLQTRSTAIFNKLKISSSHGYGINSLQLNVQSSDQKSSYSVLSKNTLSIKNTFSMIDLCDPHKYYNLDQRVIVYYKYSNLARDCVKIFRAKLSTNNLGNSQIGVRFMQALLVNNTVQNDTIEVYNGTLFKQANLMASLSNGSAGAEFERFYLSKTDTLSLFMRASAGREFYGFIAEVLIYPTAQYLPKDTYIELSDTEIKNNQLGAISLVTAGERNPNFFIIRNRLIYNGFEYFNWTTAPTADITLQNVPEFSFGNNFIANNYGGVALQLHSGSSVLITTSIVYNNFFYGNRNDTILCAKGGLQLPYNELTIDKNVFIENHSPRTDIVVVSGLISKFTRNQLLFNKGARILYTQGFENVSTPRYQDITFNLIRDNFAYGIINDLEDPNRFRSTMVAASVKQVYYSNYLFNKENDFELTALADPLSIAFLNNLRTSTPAPYYFNNEFNSNSFDRPLDSSGMGYDKFGYPHPNQLYYDVNFDPSAPTTKPNDWSKLASLVAHTGSINATNNYWSTNVDTEIRARIRDKYDNATLFEVIYSPAVPDEFKLRDGKCELGWTLIDDTCYTYVGSYVTYREAEYSCKKFESRLARETVAPIKLPRFRKLARSSQFDFERQSYRRMWLYTEMVLGGEILPPESKCSVIDDFGVATENCNEFLPFICEKDPVFLGAAFRFKDEIAFALAAVGALIVCILLLSLLWLYKSRKRKKEHIDRQNTLRSSARTHRHMINNSAFSTLNSSSMVNKSSNALYGGITGSSVDNLSTSRSIINGGGRNVNGGIYNSQRNQYFATKKHKQNGDSSNQNQNEKKQDPSTPTTPRTFITTGLDNNEGADYYGGRISKSGESSSGDENELNIKNQTRTDQSNQYHIYDPNNTNKSSKYYSQNDDDDDEDTTTDELTDDTAITKQNRNRFTIKEHSPGDSSNRTTETFTENNFINELNNKQFIQARLVKSYDMVEIQPPAKQSTPNLANKANFNHNPMTYKTSFDQLMNTTMTTDTEDDVNDANSRRLLTNKVNTSNMEQPPAGVPTSKRKMVNSSYYPQNPIISQPQATSTFKKSYNNEQDFDSNSRNNTSTFTNGSILSKSTMNMTNVTPLNNSISTNTNGSDLNLVKHNNNINSQKQITASSSEYENLNEILNTYPQPHQVPIVPVQQRINQPNGLNKNLLKVVEPRSTPPNIPPPPVPPPQHPKRLFTPQTTQRINNNNCNDTDDTDSLMSCQLITSANLLLNREPVREAKQTTQMIKPVQPAPTLPNALSQYKMIPHPSDRTIINTTDTDETDSVMSCQLITSASLLLNRDMVREARNIENNPQVLNRKQFPVNTKPRQFIPNQIKTINESSTQTQPSIVQQKSNNPNVEYTPQESQDVSKPPPMETAI